MELTDLRADLIFIFFIYGLAFFSMGIAMLLEAGRSPLLAEARILRPLAAFGILHGAHEWLEIFLLQADWLGIQLPDYYVEVRLLLLTISFASLVAFGVQVLRPPQRLAALDAFVASGMLVMYVVAIFVAGALPDRNPLDWALRADALARYFLAVPGGALAALALRYHSKKFRFQNLKGLDSSLKIAAWGFAVYGLTQLFVSPTEMYLASSLNADWFLNVFGVPVQTVRGAVAILITLGLIRATQVTDKERQRQLVDAQKERLEALERVKEELIKQEDLRRELLRHTVITQEEERSRISRELHDETAQSLTALSVNLAALQNRLPKDPQLRILSRRLLELTDQMARDLHRLVHDLRPAQLDDLGLASALQFLTEEISQNFGLRVSLRVSGERFRLDSFVETVLYRIAQEALTNVVRHAQTNYSQVRIHFSQEFVSLVVEDHGCGFALNGNNTLPAGLGLAGMKERAESVGGQFLFHSAPGKGTKIQVTVPLVQGMTEPFREEKYEDNQVNAGG